MDANNTNPRSAEWTTGLFGCFEDFSSCWVTACVPFVTFGRTAEILDRGHTSCVSAGRTYVLLAHLGLVPVCLYTCTNRTKLRALFSLPKEPCGDFCVHFFCNLCAICQEHRELKNRGLDPSKGWAFNAPIMERVTTTPPAIAMGMAR